MSAANGPSDNRVVGVIGLGAMGQALCKSFLDAGYTVHGFDIAEPPRIAAAGIGVTVLASSRDVARHADAIITVLPHAADVEDALFGPEGAAHGAHERTVVIESSTVDLPSFRRIASRMQSVGITVIDAGIFAAPPSAKEGRGAMVVAGARDAFERCEVVLSHLFRNGRVIFVGEGGSAKIVKLLGNMVGAIQVLALTEAFDLGLRAGVDARAIFEGLGAGMGDCWALHVRPPHAGLVEGSPADRAFEPGSPLDYIVKDLEYFLSSAHVLGTTPLLASVARELYGYASRAGLGKKDMVAVSLLFYGGDTMLLNEAIGPGERTRASRQATRPTTEKRVEST